MIQTWVYLKADTISRPYGLPEKPDRTDKIASVFGTGCFDNRPVLGATGPVIYGGTDVIWSTESLSLCFNFTLLKQE